MDLLCVSAASFCTIAPQHYSNPNISPRFQCQTSYTISDKNNGPLQSESQVSERWINTRQRCFLSREDDQGGQCSGVRGFPVWIWWQNAHSVFPVQPSFVITARLQRKRWPRSTNGIWHKENISRLLLIKATLVQSVICQRSCNSLLFFTIRPRSGSFVQTLSFSFSLNHFITVHIPLKRWSEIWQPDIMHLCVCIFSAQFGLIIRNKVLFVSGCNRNSLQVVGELIQKVHSCAFGLFKFLQVVWKQTLHLKTINATISGKT